MIRALHIALLASSATLAACGGVESPLAPLAPEAPNPDPSLNGTFHGVFNGLDGEVMLAARVQFALLEAGGALAGTFSIEGILDDGVTRSEVAGTGTLAGSVGESDAAAVSFTTQSDFCLHSSDFSGVYHRQTGVLGIDGTVHVLDQNCTVVLTFPLSLAMRR